MTLKNAGLIVLTLAAGMFAGAAGPVDENARDGINVAEPRSVDSAAVQARGSIGPDLITADIQDAVRFGRVAGITAYGVGNYACNIGDESVNWIASSDNHPVLLQNMYRLKDGRFEQIGAAWAFHEFFALNQDFCSVCVPPPSNNELGLDCSTVGSDNLHGAQHILGPRSDIDALTGYFTFPFSAPDPDPTIGRRLQVGDAYLDPDRNSGALYFVEAQYIAADDAAAGNALNNASYRSVAVNETTPYVYDINVTGVTQQEVPAIRAWKANDPSVVETDVQIPAEGLFILAATATDLGSGLWHYEYALHNMTSDRSAGSFSVPLPSGAVATNIGFHDVDYHSGEIYDISDWTSVAASGRVTWSTESYGVNPTANALRFGTTYNFRFDTNAEPGPELATLDLFKPYDPPDVAASTVGPVTVTGLPHNACADCIPVITGLTFAGTTNGSSGADISSCADGDTNDVWHCWTADCTG